MRNSCLLWDLANHGTWSIGLLSPTQTGRLVHLTRSDICWCSPDSCHLLLRQCGDLARKVHSCGLIMSASLTSCVRTHLLSDLLTRCRWFTSCFRLTIGSSTLLNGKLRIDKVVLQDLSYFALLVLDDLAHVYVQRDVITDFIRLRTLMAWALSSSFKLRILWLIQICANRCNGKTFLIDR